MRGSRVLFSIGLSVGALQGTAVVANELPTAVVERQRFFYERSTRVSLFDNRVAVATVSEGEQQVFFRQFTLGEDEYEVYLQVLLEVADTAGRWARVPVVTNERESVIHLRVPGYEPRVIRYSLLAVPDVHTARLFGLLDDIELRVSKVAPAEEELSRWQPEEGDRVELLVGGEAVVTDVREGGVIVLAYTSNSILEVVPPDQRHTVILRVVE